MSNGLPVIASDTIKFCHQIVENEHCGLLADPLDVEEIVSLITCLKDNPQIATSMGENGKKAVAERYNWQTQERLLIAFYHRITAKRD